MVDYNDLNLGWSLGGYLALEVARILAQGRDHEVMGLVMIDSPLPHGQKDDGNASTRQDPLRFLGDTTPEKRKMQVQSVFHRQWRCCRLGHCHRGALHLMI